MRFNVARGSLASSVGDLSALEEVAEMISGESGFAGRLGERQRLGSEQLQSALKLDGGYMPQAS